MPVILKAHETSNTALHSSHILDCQGTAHRHDPYLISVTFFEYNSSQCCPYPRSATLRNPQDKWCHLH